MARAEDLITVKGEVTERLPNDAFMVLVTVAEKEYTIRTRSSGKIKKNRGKRKNSISIVLGDKVTVEIPKDNISNGGRIIHRHNK